MALTDIEKKAVRAICKYNSLKYDNCIKRPSSRLDDASKSRQIRDGFLDNVETKRHWLLTEKIGPGDFNLLGILQILRARKLAQQLANDKYLYHRIEYIDDFTQYIKCDGITHLLKDVNHELAQIGAQQINRL